MTRRERLRSTARLDEVSGGEECRGLSSRGAISATEWHGSTIRNAVQYTPPIGGLDSFGDGITTMEPGSQQGLVLAAANIDATREDVIGRGVDVSELWHFDPEQGQVSGRDPENRPYRTRASFSDPDGNGWVLQ